MGVDVRTFVAEDLWLLIAIVTFAAAGLVAVAGFGGLAAGVTTVGWFLLTPVFLFWGEEIATVAFGDDAESVASPETDADALETLKRRYAEGKIDEETFERRLERLIEADETVVRHGSSDEAVDVPSTPASDFETETDAERER